MNRFLFHSTTFAGRLVTPPLHTLLLTILLCPPTFAQNKVSFQQSHLYVEGKPFFFLGVDGVPDNLESMRQHHLNTVFGWGAARQDAAQAGLMFIPYIHSPEARLEQVEQQVNELKNDPGLLAWNAGDDLIAKDLDRTRQVCDLVRRLDPGHPIMLDVIDSSTVSFAPFVDMFCIYSYPLLWKEWPLQRYRKWLESAKEKVGNDTFRWTWVQVHTQLWYTHEVHGGPEEQHIPSLFPDAEHLRLLTYTAIQAGMRGIIYYHHNFLREDWHGKDRYAEVGILGSELEVFGPLLAEGKVVGVAKTDRPDVHATLILFSKGLLVVLAKEGKRYQYHPDESVVRKVEVSFPNSLAPQTGTALQVEFPQPQSLPIRGERERLRFVVPEFELTTTILLTTDAQLSRSVRDRVASLAPDAARFALRVVEGKREKVEPVLEGLRVLQVGLPEASSSVKRSRELERRARESLDRGDFASAYRAAREAQRVLRELESRYWSTAAGNKEPSDHKYLRCFYDLPEHYTYVREVESLAEGDNLLANGSFEMGEDSRAKDWREPAMTNGGQAMGSRSHEKARTGRYSYRFASTSMSEWQGQKWDWVTADAKTQSVPVEPGQFAKLSAYIHIPETISDTQRGAILNLLAFDKESKAVPGWEGMKIEVNCLKKTRGWQQLSVLRKIDDPRVARVGVRIGICGMGECYFDDVKLCRMIPRPH
ncbi:MAG: hypothetical protein HY318_01810 [Armatimonadetes bacterium]|nr:hypothetical protein [Armatimonadota bacterium]